jgi:hypothetical protein
MTPARRPGLEPPQMARCPRSWSASGSPGAVAILVDAELSHRGHPLARDSVRRRRACRRRRVTRGRRLPGAAMLAVALHDHERTLAAGPKPGTAQAPGGAGIRRSPSRGHRPESRGDPRPGKSCTRRAWHSRGRRHRLDRRLDARQSQPMEMVLDSTSERRRCSERTRSSAAIARAWLVVPVPGKRDGAARQYERRRPVRGRDGGLASGRRPKQRRLGTGNLGRLLRTVTSTSGRPRCSGEPDLCRALGTLGE